MSGRNRDVEILYPVATVILGGLVTSTFCEFLIHPGLFWHFSGQDAAELARHASDEDDPEAWLTHSGPPVSTPVDSPTHGGDTSFPS